MNIPLFIFFAVPLRLGGYRFASDKKVKIIEQNLMEEQTNYFDFNFNSIHCCPKYLKI
jgi:hypothetical protein